MQIRRRQHERHDRAAAFQLDDAILNLRTNELEVGSWVLKTQGDAGLVIKMDEVLARLKDHWLVKETTGALRRTLARLDAISRSLIALVDAGYRTGSDCP